MTERVQKILSRHGGSLPATAEQMIEAGRVRINGEPAFLGQKADPIRDIIEVDQQLINPEQRPGPCYLLLHKPLGMVSTCFDPEGRPTVLKALPEPLHQVGIHPVGRLDAYSTGALLLTNDGDLTYRLTHPKHNVVKTYRVEIEGAITSEALGAWQNGVLLDGQLTRPAQVRVLKFGRGNSTWLQVELREGRNRQIRRVAEALGHRVLSLHRTAVGSIQLGNLKSGSYRSLSSAEIKALLAELEIPAAILKKPVNSSVSVSRF
ncbi:MAG: rRNA pseudouridine synthase [Leptolyngbyaceae cyanobacterium SM2_3_12]|nr:rRNA pseudouridine synthase [Leptolyngbyaceae cyanobacterium SM2_3_12]